MFSGSIMPVALSRISPIPHIPTSDKLSSEIYIFWKKKSRLWDWGQSLVNTVMQCMPFCWVLALIWRCSLSTISNSCWSTGALPRILDLFVWIHLNFIYNMKTMGAHLVFIYFYFKLVIIFIFQGPPKKQYSVGPGLWFCQPGQNIKVKTWATVVLFGTWGAGFFI